MSVFAERVYFEQLIPNLDYPNSIDYYYGMIKAWHMSSVINSNQKEELEMLVERLCNEKYSDLHEI